MKNKPIIAVLGVFIAICLLAAVVVTDYLAADKARTYHNITDMKPSYDADAEIAQALKRLQTSSEKSALVTGNDAGGRQIILTFDGLADPAVMNQILDLLQRYNSKAVFFADGIRVAENPEAIVAIQKAGHRIGNYTLYGRSKIEKLTAEQMVKDFCQAQKIITINTDQEAGLLKCYDTNYTDQLLKVAKACGFTGVVKSDVMLTVKDLRQVADADAIVSRIKTGSVVSVKLTPPADPVLPQREVRDARPAIDKLPGLKEVALPERNNKEVAEAVENLLIALRKTGYDTVFPGKPSPIGIVSKFLAEQVRAFFALPIAYGADRRSSPDGQEIKTVYTTEQALSFTFGGLSNPAAVDDVLIRLQTKGIRGTFFVSDNEVKRYLATVSRIVAEGHEIGIAIRPRSGASSEETSQAIRVIQKTLQERFGVTAVLVKQISGAVEDATRSAVADTGCTLIGQSINVVQSKHKDYESAEQIMNELFKTGMVSLSRGQILYFRMDFYTRPELAGELMDMIKTQKVDNIAYATSYDNPAFNKNNDSAYNIKPIGELLHNRHYTYEYPVPPERVLSSLGTGAFGQVMKEGDFLAEVKKRYIGHPSVNYEDRLHGFSKTEARRLDTSGTVHTTDNIIFLTFDDWGNDAALNKILYVLRKHKVPGTFFVITKNILYNPNLLRSIAVEGHNIGSHSDSHQAMGESTTEKDKYEHDFTHAYQKLLQVTGDVTVNGKPVLTQFFRPATLAVSKDGLKDVFAAGYRYVISGSLSTNDYKTQDITQLVTTIKNGIYNEYGEVKKGSVLIFHMSDSTLYAATALDILLTANAIKSDDDPSKFKVGRLSDYLAEGYSQGNRKQSLRLQNQL